MHKPRYTEELLKIIFFWLAIAFLLFGVLCLVGVVRPRENSMVQAPAILGLIFSIMGVCFLGVYIVLLALVIRKNELHAKLVSTGIQTEGTVEKVYLQRYTQYGRECPYRIRYTYSCGGKEYHHKSAFLWEKPNYQEGDPIDVYRDEDGRSTVML